MVVDSAKLYQPSYSNKYVDSEKAVVLWDDHHGISRPDQSCNKR